MKKRVQKRNLGLANTSRQRQTCKQNAGCSKDSQRMENISNYFVKTTDQKPEISPRALGPDVIIESPYQNLSADIRPIINTSITEENDFKTPKPIKRIAKIFDTKTSSKNKKIRSKSKSKSKWSGNKSSKKQHATTKIVGDNFQNSDVNAEQLQMALALSKSIQDNESSSEHEDDLKTLYPSTQQKLATIKQTLEQFGFKPSKSKVDVEKIISEKLPKPKKSKYQYVTPILYIRTEEDRESLISSKISLILSNAQEEPGTSNNTEINLFSKYLKKLHCTHADIFKQSRLGSEHENFYVKNFNLSPCKLKCGHLLKRWEDIPGRDATPPRELTTIEKTNVQIEIDVDGKYAPPNKIENKCNQFDVGISDDEKQEIIHAKLVRKSLSPDLFSSDEDDYQITKINKIIDDKLESSFEILDNIKHAHLQANNIYQPLNLASARNKSTASFPFKGCNLSLDNVNSKSVLSISTTVHENVMLRKNVDVFSASMLSNFETTMGDESCLKTTEFSDSENGERGNNFEEFNDLTQSSDSEEIMKCMYNNDDVTDNVTSLIKIDGETQKTIDPQTSGSVLPKSQTISDKSCLSYSSDELLDLTQSSDGSYEDHKISEVKTDIDFDQINEYKYAENKNSIVKNHTSLNLNDKYELCELSYSDIGNLQNINNSSNETVKISVTESNKRNSFEMDKTELLSQNNKPAFKLRQNRMKIIELISDSDTEIEENVESNKKSSEYDTMSTPLKLSYSNRVSETEDSKGIRDDECSEQNIQNYDYKFQTLDKTKVNQQFTKHDSFKSATSECSQESVYISDEELNYSSVYSALYVKKSTSAENIYKRTSYEFSDDSAVDEVTADVKKFEDERNNQLEQSNNASIPNETTTFKNIAGEKHEFKNDTMAFVDELLNNTNYKCYRLNKMEGESTVENQSIVRNHINMDYNEYVDDHCMDPDYTPTDIVDEHMTTVDNHSIYQLNSLSNNSDKTSTSHKLLNSTNDLLHIENPNQRISEDPGYLNICKNDELPTTPINKTQAQNNATPGGALFIKTNNVTPVPPYESMNSPKIAAELEKFGLKNLKRKRGIQMLKHIYESTHPMIELTNEDINDVNEVIKRRKRSGTDSSQNLNNHPSSRNSLSNANNCDIFNGAVMDDGNIEIIGDLLSQNVPEEDLIFEKKQSVKVASCRIPLHIVWHNLTSSQPKLKESILLYEPLQLEVLYAILKENGFKFDIKDLLTFLDKKCITVRTNQHQVKKKNTK